MALDPGPGTEVVAAGCGPNDTDMEQGSHMMGRTGHDGSLHIFDLRTCRCVQEAPSAERLSLRVSARVGPPARARHSRARGGHSLRRGPLTQCALLKTDAVDRFTTVETSLSQQASYSCCASMS